MWITALWPIITTLTLQSRMVEIILRGEQRDTATPCKQINEGNEARQRSRACIRIGTVIVGR
jgi:hypothetical protein